MNRHIAPVLAIIFHFAAASLPAAEPPPAVARLKAAGINVSALKEGGWNVEVRAAKDLDDHIWKQIETLPDVRRFSANDEQFDDAALARLAKIGSRETQGRAARRGSGHQEPGGRGTAEAIQRVGGKIARREMMGVAVARRMLSNGELGRFKFF